MGRLSGALGLWAMGGSSRLSGALGLWATGGSSRLSATGRPSATLVSALLALRKRWWSVHHSLGRALAALLAGGRALRGLGVPLAALVGRCACEGPIHVPLSALDKQVNHQLANHLRHGLCLDHGAGRRHRALACRTGGAVSFVSVSPVALRTCIVPLLPRVGAWGWRWRLWVGVTVGVGGGGGVGGVGG